MSIVHDPTGYEIHFFAVPAIREGPKLRALIDFLNAGAAEFAKSLGADPPRRILQLEDFTEDTSDPLTFVGPAPFHRAPGWSWTRGRCTIPSWCAPRYCTKDHSSSTRSRPSIFAPRWLLPRKMRPTTWACFASCTWRPTAKTPRSRPRAVYRASVRYCFWPADQSGVCRQPGGAAAPRGRCPAEKAPAGCGSTGRRSRYSVASSRDRLGAGP